MQGKTMHGQRTILRSCPIQGGIGQAVRQRQQAEYPPWNEAAVDARLDERAFCLQRRQLLPEQVAFSAVTTAT